MTKISLRFAFGAACVATAVLTGTLSGQQASFRTSTELVSVDVLATDADGRPITDLKATDFQLKVDGKSRPVQSAQLVRATATSAPTSATPEPSAPAPLPPAFATNTEPPGRTFVIAVDQENIHPGNERQAIESTMRLLDRLTPADRVAVVTVPKGRVEADLTTNRDVVRAALGRVQGHMPRSSSKYEISIEEGLAAASRSRDDLTERVVQEMIARECEHEGGVGCGTWVRGDAQIYGQQITTSARDSVRGLATLVEGLSTLEGPKSLIFISERLVTSHDLEQDLADLGRVADTARVRFYVIQVNRPLFDVGRRRAPADESGDVDREVTGLGNVASVTSGEIFRTSARVDAVLSHIDAVTSSYYLLGFEPGDKERDGKYHKIEIALTRKGATLHARGGFSIPTRSASQQTDADRSPLASLLRDNLATYRDLPLRAAAFAFRGAAADYVKILVMAEPQGDRPLTDAAVALISESGGQGAEWTTNAPKTGPFVTAGEVLSGAYRVRVAAGDADGRRGVVDVRLSAALGESGTLRWSALLPGVTSATGFEPRLDFPGAKAITGFLEIYGAPLLAAPPSATLELVATIDGPALATVSMAIAPTEAADRHLAQATIGIPETAPAGNLMLRATIRVDGKPVGTVSQTIHR